VRVEWRPGAHDLSLVLRQEGKPGTAQQAGREDGLGDMVMDPSAPRQLGFESLDLTLNEIKKVETYRGMLKLKLAQQDVYLSPFTCRPLRRLRVHRRAALPTPTPPVCALSGT